MAYTPTTWNTGDTITATKLNKLENGVADAGGALIVGITRTGSENAGYPIFYGTALDKTFEEIYTAISEGIPVYVKVTVATSGVADYFTSASMGRVTMAYKYDTVYRIFVEAPQFWQGPIRGTYNVALPSTIVFTASSASSYPIVALAASFSSTNAVDMWD